MKLIGDGDLSAAISCAVSGTGVHAVMGIGGAPEGVITAAALRCLGGEIQARFRYRNDDERAARRAVGQQRRGPRVPPGTCPGREPRLRGDRRPRVTCSRASASSARRADHSLVMAYQTKQVRFVDTVHVRSR